MRLWLPHVKHLSPMEAGEAGGAPGGHLEHVKVTYLSESGFEVGLVGTLGGLVPHAGTSPASAMLSIITVMAVTTTHHDHSFR